MTTPAQRQTSRISAGLEPATPHPSLAPNGSLFTIKGGAPHSGSVAFETTRALHSIDEAAADGGVQTWDRSLAEALRGLGIYNETKL